jgi:hypothetical protein
MPAVHPTLPPSEFGVSVSFFIQCGIADALQLLERSTASSSSSAVVARSAALGFIEACLMVRADLFRDCALPQCAPCVV